MDSESSIIEVVIRTESSDYDRRTGDNKTWPKNWCRQFARPQKVLVCDSLDRLANASERTASTFIYNALFIPIIISHNHNTGQYTEIRQTVLPNKFETKYNCPHVGPKLWKSIMVKHNRSPQLLIIIVILIIIYFV